MEPLDPEMQQWLAAQAKEARQERAEPFAAMKAKADALIMADARGVLASIPPLLPGQTRTFVNIFETSALPPEETREARVIEGTIFDIFGVMTGSMSGSDDYDAFRVISEGDRITSWRKDSLRVARGDFVRIKYVPRHPDRDDDDHDDDAIVEVSVGS